ncbi:hypothetical protein ACVW00_001491 [Marmoricola sp. URHA0025 HA25]
MTGPIDTGDDDLRRLLHEAVADVRPRDALDDIRSRTDKVIPMKRWFLPTLAVAAVMAAVVGGAFWLTDDDQKVAPSTTPTVGPSQTPTTSSTDPGHAPRAVPVYFAGSTAHGDKLFREFQRKDLCGDTDCLLKAAAVAAVNGKPDDPDYRTLWPAGATVGRVGQDGDTIVIDLASGVRDRPAEMSADDAGLAVQQLVYSAQAAVGRGRLPVQLLIDGQHTDMVLGVPAAEPLAADNPDDVLAPVQVDSPADGAQVSGTFTVTGRAAAFEANVAWELTQDGDVVKHGFTTAQECCTLSPYSFEVTAPPGTYTLVVHDTDESGGGRPVDQDTKEITVQ